MAKPLTQLIKTLTDSADEATKAGQATADGFTDDALAEISNQVDEFDFSGAKERAINSETMKPKYSEFTGRQDEALYKQSDVYFEDVKNEFLDNFEPDVDADEIMFSLDSFSPKMQGFLKQMNNADWLGFVSGSACFYQSMCPGVATCSTSYRCACPSGYLYQGSTCVPRIIQPVVVQPVIRPVVIQPRPTCTTCVQPVVVRPAPVTCTTCVQPQVRITVVAPGQPCQLRGQCGGGSSCIYTINLGVCTCPSRRTSIGGICQVGVGVNVVQGCRNGCVVGAGDYCAYGSGCVSNSQCLNQICRCNLGWIRRGKTCLSYRR